MRVQAAPPEHFGWLCERLSASVSSDMRAIELLDNEGQIVAMVGYQHWRPNSVRMLFSSARPLAWRPLIRPAFSYPFETREILLVDVPSHSEELLRVARRLGFSETHRVRDGYAPGDDLIELEMRRDSCRWRT